jgi:hypothetical protein
MDDPGLFLDTVAAPTILDEIQYVPELLSHIKIRVDSRRGTMGQFIMTGSQIFNLMAGLTESLAGRAAIIELLPFSNREIALESPQPLPDLYSTIYKGFYPDPCVHGVDARLYYGSYLQTYIERDIRQITSVHDLSVFQRFIELLAARAASILNLSEVGRDCGISHTSAQNWISLLENSRIVYLLRPFFSNIGKRLIKSPKLYFTDTGLLTYLLKYPDPKTLLAGPMAGPLFENFMVIEMLKHKFHELALFDLFFYRDSNKNEIDLMVETAQFLHLIEIKMRKTIRREDVAVLDKFEFAGKGVKRWIVSLHDSEIMISSKSQNLPWWRITSMLDVQS